jgi:hypothetical protein
MKIAKILFKIFCLLFLVLNLQSCYYDNMEDLYPQNAACDTSSVNYSNSISTILSDNCTSCHSGSSPSGGVKLDDYNSVKSCAQSGKLYSSVTWDGSAARMPQGSGSKINDCSIAKIRIWIQSNYPQ